MRLVALGAAAAIAVVTVQLPAQAASLSATAGSAGKPAAAKQAHPAHRSCAKSANPAKASCSALVRDDIAQTRAQVAAEPDATPSGLGPADLQAAYDLPSASAGGGQTVAIVDAYDNPSAEAELATYRTQFGLPACTTANGCFSKIDQRGGTSYPAANSGWAGEIALDLQMVSAVCPNCKILLVEADSASMANLGTAVNQAVAKGAKFVSNSYGGAETSNESSYDTAYFNHPGVAITASTGDDGYGVSYPAASPYVTAVGGTSLTKDTTATRGWSESVWAGAGSGCSAYETKPTVQSDSGCPRRAVADVSAVADPNTGVAVYNAGAWHVYGGTSASAPIIASVYALAGTPAAGSSPMSFPYARTGDLNDVTTGTNGSCGTYLCQGATGYDGPTGLGTPKGVGAFNSGPYGTFKGSVTDAATGKPVAGARVTAGDSSTVTGADGSYAMTATPDTYDLTVSKFGYRSRTLPGVALADGQTLTEDAALTAKAHARVTGTVKDDSGHGWPLYATVQVKGEPTSAVHTDPATGRYTMDIPAGDTYTLQSTPVYPGYTQDSADVTVTDSDVTADFGVGVDAASCTAPGYAAHIAGTTQDFTSATITSPPAGWSVTDAAGNGQVWAFRDGAGAINETGGTARFALIDSSVYGSAKQDTTVVSSAYDLSGKTHPYLSYATAYAWRTGSSADVDYSLDGGTTWTNATHWATASHLGPRTETVDLTAAAGRSDVRLRFHYIGSGFASWQVDNVFVGERTCAPTPGGLVLGQVTDKNTGKGVAGAKVTSTDKPAESATSAPTPDDAALGDGFYWYFSTLTGTHPLSVVASHYLSPGASANIAADAATTADLELKAGRLTVTPPTVSANLKWQGSASKTVTVTNTGSADASLRLDEDDRGFGLQAKAKGAVAQTIKGSYSPGFIDPAHDRASAASAPVVPSAAPWTSLANLPTAVMDNAVATGPDGRVYSVGGLGATSVLSSVNVYDPQATTWAAAADPKTAREAPQAAFLGGKLYVTGGWGADGSNLTSTQIYDPTSNTWTSGASIPKGFAGAGSAVVAGKWYVVGGCATACGSTAVQVYDPAKDAWSSAAAYPEVTSWLGCGAIAKSLYCAGGSNGSKASAHAYTYNPSTDTWTPIADLPFDLWAMGATGAGGKLLLSGGVTANSTALTNKGIVYDPMSGAWSALPNSNTTVFRAGSACGFYKVGGSTGGFNPVKTAELLPGYGDCASSADVAWLNEDHNEATLAPGASLTVTLSMDADLPEINQPGTFSAELAVANDTPYTVQPIDVSMSVTPPSSWGKITGMVSGAPCAGSATALKGATVALAGKQQSYTLKTDASGKYALWLDIHNNPLTEIVAKDGWTPQTLTVKIVKGSTVTKDFTLSPDSACG
ncbi:carboxypeptidase regulatory-like domain-containing protein [Streptomyces sp. NPDC050738]|uniref:carboxypeptidase regulatory-like domain-containing protein n=1 Tax=Streptomyces sp. NPDC050738 TaxID=3154744 RepID=UPI00343FB881